MAESNKTLALMVTAGEDQGKVFPLEEGFLGKGISCSYRLTDASIADMHARLALRRDVWHITDLTADPDIRVNNAIIKSRRIQYGDKIAVGNTELQVIETSEIPEEPKKIESKQRAAASVDKPKSQTMEIAVNPAAEGWIPGKPKPKPKPVPKVEKEIKTERRKINTAPKREIKAVGASTYSSLHSKKAPAQDHGGSKAMLYFLLIVAILLPLLIGGIVIGNKRSSARQLSRAFSEAQSFEARHPERREEVIEMYRRIEMMATGSNENSARLARERIRKLEAAAPKPGEALAKALTALDARAVKLADEGKPNEAIKVYENYQGGLRDEILAARADQIRALKALTASSSVAATTPAPGTTSPPSSRKEPTPPPAEELKDAEKKVQQIAAAAVDHMLGNDVPAAIKEIEKILRDATLSGYKRAAENAVLSLKLLQTIDRTSKLDPDKDPANDQEQRPFIRLIYSLRKNDIFAAQFLVSKVKGSLFYDELAKRSAMSKEAIKKETAIMGEFLTLWSKFTKSPANRIPRPDECVKKLEQVIDAREEKAVDDFCNAMRKLQKDHPDSKFIERYKALFKTCDPKGLTAATPSTQLSGIGDAKIIRSGLRTITFEAARTIPDPKEGRVGIFSEKEIYFDPGKETTVAADIELHTVVEYKKLNDRQGTFELPAGYDRDKPVKGDRIFVKTGIKTGSKLVSLIREQKSETLYVEDFVWKRHGSRWHSKGANLHMEGKIKLSPADDSGRPAGTPKAWFDINLSKPAVIDMIIIRDNEAPLSIIVGDAQFVVSRAIGAPAEIWRAGHKIKDQRISALPLHKPIPVKITWTPLTTSLKIGTDTLSVATDTARKRPTPKLVGFLLGGSFSINKFQVLSGGAVSGTTVAGVNKTKSAVIISRGDSEAWKSLKEGDAVFLINKGSGSASVSTPAKVTESEEKFLLCALTARAPVTSSTAVSLTKTADSSALRASPYALGSSRWSPEIVFGQAKLAPSGDIAISPNVSCSYARQGFISRAIKTIWQPNTQEPLMAYPVDPTVALFSEAGGVLKAKVQNTEAFAGEQNVVVSRLAPPVGAPAPLTPMSFTIPASATARSPQSWTPQQGSWQLKLGRLLGPTVTGGIAVVSVPQALWENCQYSVNAKIEAPAPKSDMPELIVEIYSPFWRKSLALVTGTGGTAIEFDKIRNAGKALKLNPSAYIPYNERSPKWEASFKTSKPKLTPEKTYNIKIRRVNGTIAYYINGKRIATVRYPGMAGDIRLRVGCAGGRISLGTSSATAISRSAKIAASEPPTGEFGYIVAVDGKRLFVDADGNGLSKGARVSVMKVVEGAEGGETTLRRVAVGTVSQSAARVVKCVITAATEPPEIGMKVMAGLQPDELKLTQLRRASLNDGL